MTLIIPSDFSTEVLLSNDFLSELVLSSSDVFWVAELSIPNDFLNEISIPNDLLLELATKPTIDNGDYVSMLAAIDADAVADLPMLEANESGTDTTDVSGNNNDAELINSPTKLVTAGYKLNDTETIQSLQIADSPTMRLTDKGTISVLLKNVDLSVLTPADGWTEIFGQMNSDGTYFGFFMFVWPNDYNDWADANLGVQFSNVESDFILASAPVNFVFNEHHFIMSWDIPQIQIYVDGVLAGSTNFSFVPVAPERALTFGAPREDIPYYSAVTPFPADFCRIKVLNRMVSEAEARVLFSEAARDSFKI